MSEPERLSALVAREVMDGRPITIMEPEGGLTDAQRAAVKRAMEMVVEGDWSGAMALLHGCGLDLTVERVKDGRLVLA
jgi:hypothetical protein